MDIIASLNAEWKQELAFTRTLLERVPEDFTWKPHAKSMTLGRLATHVAEIPGLMTITLTRAELDFAEPGRLTTCSNTRELLSRFDASAAASTAALENAREIQLDEKWTLRDRDQVYFTLPKSKVLRSFVFSHLIHHRAQLGVYLRILDISIPATYGPSADEQ